MSNLVEFTDTQLSLIRKSVAPTATPQEFDLFIYRCKHMGLDPLKPGQIHFAKFGNSAGTIMVGIEGFRSRAAKTGKHSGTKRGVLRNDEGRCIGAWCEVYRSDWTHPAREEVALSEYNTGKGLWSRMPETMIKKVAECAALRMAFPDELGGVYERAELDQADTGTRDVTDSGDLDSEDLIPASLIETNTDLHLGANHIIGGGARKGQRLGDVVEEVGLPGAMNYMNNLESLCQKDNKPLWAWARELKVNLGRYERDRLGGAK